MSSLVKIRGSRRARPTAEAVAVKLGRHAHKELVNVDGPSQIERGVIESIDLREVVALRAAIDDALYDIAARFNLKYRVLRGRFGIDGAEYRIGLGVKERPSNVPFATPGKPIVSARMPKPRAAK